MKEEDEEEEERDSGRFLKARNGDNLMTPFKCDLCHFRDIWGVNPDVSSRRDRWRLTLIRRANLDAMWAREPTTVSSNTRDARLLESIGSGELQMSGVMPQMGPYPSGDSFGMKVAVCMLVRSLDPGKNEPTIQFGTMRRLRSAYSNSWNASARGMQGVPCPTDSYWFKRFMLGAHKRMGDEVKTDYGISIQIVHEVLKNLGKEWNNARTVLEKFKLAEFAMVLILGFCLGLRGEEITLTRLEGFFDNFNLGRQHPTFPHVIVKLMGRFKSETGERCHVKPLAWETTSGIAAGMWTERFLDMWLKAGGKKRGFAFADEKGRPKRYSEFDAEFVERVKEVQDTRPNLFPHGVNINDSYSLRRSPRRGSTSEAQNRNIPGEVVDMNNRWRKVERAGAKAPNMTMRQHYTEIELMLPTLIKYSLML